MTKTMLGLAQVVGLVVVAGCGSASTDGTATTSSASSASDLSGLRRSTAAYHDVSAANAAGYYPHGGAAEPCVSAPGLGTMGVHYVNFQRAFAPLEENNPAILVYLPTPDGPELVAVEWVQFIYQDGQPYTGDANHPPRAESIPPSPVLFGQTFQGPMPGHFPGMPWHFDMHAWVWHHNPSGMFAPFNPAISCP